MIRKGDQIGPYTLLEKIGRGGFGVVWLAEKRASLVVTKVALKLANDDDIDLEAIRREAAVWVQASGHPNVLPIIDADIYDDQVVIVSEYAPDGSLDKWLKNNNGRAPSIAEAIEMASKILAGLEHLHSKKIIHRDLKPQNILLQGRTPRLVDFGLARVMKSTSNSRTVSGTYSYMPPETFEGSRSEQTDIWSVGVILYEMLTGTLPYPQTHDAALIGAILHGKSAPLPEYLSKTLRAVVERSIEKDLNKRFKTAAEMRTALRDAALVIQTNESSAPVTEVLHRFSNTFVSEEYKNTEALEEQEEDSLYKTTVMPHSETDSLSFDYDSQKRKTPEPGPVDLAVTKPLKPQNEMFSTDSLEIKMEVGITDSLEIKTEVGATDSREIKTEVGTTNFQELKPETNTTHLQKPETIIGTTPPQDFRTTKEHQPRPSRENSVPFAMTRKLLNAKNIDESESTGIFSNRKVLFIGAGVFGLFIISAFVLVTSYLIISSFSTNRNENVTAETKSSDNQKSQTRQKQGNFTGREIRVLTAQSVVNEVAISGDGKVVASVGGDNNVRLWRIGESNSPTTFSGHTQTVRSVDISPNGQIVASGGDDKTVRLWNLSDGKVLRVLTGHNDWVFRVIFSPDGQKLISASGDKILRLWNVDDGKLQQSYFVGENEGLVVNISNDLRFVAYYNPTSKQVRVWSLTEGKVICELQGERFEVHGGAFSPDNNTLALGSKDGAVRLYSMTGGAQISVLQGAKEETGRVIYNSTGKFVAAGYKNGSICLWRTSDGRLLKTFKNHKKFVFALSFSADDGILVSGSEDKTMRVWEIIGN